MSTSTQTQGPVNTLPERKTATLVEASWPAARVAEALSALAARAGLPTTAPESILVPREVVDSELNPWIEAAATRAGLQADRVFVGLDELDALVAHGAPALLRMAAVEGSPFLAILGARNGRVRAIGPDLRIHSVHRATVSATVRRPFEEPIEGDIDHVLVRMALASGSRRRARARMIADRLKPVRFRGCWLIHLPPGAPVADAAREANLPRRLAALIAAHVAQYTLFVLSWWLLGRAVITGTVDRGWLFGWVLLLTSLIPLRLAATWSRASYSSSAARRGAPGPTGPWAP